MFGINQNKILKTLSAIEGPDGSGDVVSLGLLSEILIKDKVVSFAVSVDPKRAAELEP
jgi:ATP-binding protein involved in chromosome partitioning